MQSERAGCSNPDASSATCKTNRAVRTSADGLARYLASENSVLRCSETPNSSCSVVHLRGWCKSKSAVQCVSSPIVHQYRPPQTPAAVESGGFILFRPESALAEEMNAADHYLICSVCPASLCDAAMETLPAAMPLTGPCWLTSGTSAVQSELNADDPPPHSGLQCCHGHRTCTKRPSQCLPGC